MELQIRTERQIESFDRLVPSPNSTLCHLVFSHIY